MKNTNTPTTSLKDTIIILASIIIIGLSAFWALNSAIFTIPLTADTKLSWHLVRSSGIVAYLLLTASTIWGLFISGQFVKDWSPGVISMTLHSTISWLALILGLVHALLLLFDDYFKYTLGDILIPFTGPYRPEFVGLGTLAFWMIVLISLSFPLKKRLGHKNWKLLHYGSYLAFAMVSAHGLLAGTDGEKMGFRLIVMGAVFVVILLLGIRMGKDQAKPTPKARPPRVSSATTKEED